MKQGDLGFTIIELMIAFLIMGVLLTFVAVKYPASLARGRDVKRMNDLKIYQTALESYASKNGLLYPSASSGAIDVSSLCTALEIPANDCPTDPKGGIYSYETDSGGSNYTITTSLEKKLPFVVCSNGKSGYVNSVAATAGVCPNFTTV